MNSIARARTLWIVPLLVLIIGGCGDNNGTDPVDATPPQVVSHEPEANASTVPLGQTISVVFSEAMDVSSAQGHVTLNHGTITNLEWENDRSLLIEHSPWGQGLQVTVSITTGIADFDGNNLSEPYTFSFWTESTTLQLLASDPPGGATDVPRNAVIELLFTNEMDLQSLTAATTVREADGLISYQFELGEGARHGAVLLTIGPTLPPETAIEIAITTDAQDVEGTNLALPASFRFTTSGSIDTTPPEVTAIEPADGSIADPDIGYIRFTFSESMNTDSIQPTSMNAELWIQIVEKNIEPAWSQENTVLTIPLPTPLPDGLPMEITLDQFRDRNDVVQTEEFHWSSTVSGTADYVPVVDGLRFYYWHLFEEGDVGSDDPIDSFEGLDYVGQDVQSDGTFFYTDYQDSEFTISDEWEIFRKTAESLVWVGSHDEEDDEETDIVFSQPLPYLLFPIQEGTHNTSSTVDLPEGGTLDAAWTLTLIGREDVTVRGAHDGAEGQSIIFWKDCWKVTTVLDATLEGALFFERTETLWFSPTVGLVQEMREEVDHDEQSWSLGESYLLLARLP